MFENPEIAAEELPAAADLDWEPLDRRYAARLQAQALIAGTLVLIGLIAVSSLPLPVFDGMADGISVGPLAAAYVVLMACALIWPMISVPRKGYAIRARDVVYRSGVFWRAVSAIPFNRVQHVETSHTPLDRRFRLATLHLYTAGGSGGDLKIHGMPADVAERLRLFVLDRVGEEAGRD